MMVELRTRNREIGDEDENDVEDTNGYEKQGYDLPNWVGKSSYWWYYTPDRN